MRQQVISIHSHLCATHCNWFKLFTASGDDPQCSTPKRKSDAYNQSHLAGSGGTPTMHDDFEMGSPTWPRTPASPGFNSHTEQTTVHRSSKVTKRILVFFTK